MRTLSITISDDLYDSLKHTVVSKKISKFVSEAVAEKLSKTKEKLYQAYLEGNQDGPSTTFLRKFLVAYYTHNIPPPNPPLRSHTFHG